MTRPLFYLLLLMLVLVGLVFLFMPAPIEEDGPTHSEQEALPETQAIPAATDEQSDVVPPHDTDNSPPERSSSLLNARAINAWHGGDIQEAMALFEQAIDADADDPEPHANYGRLLTLMVAYEKALPLLQRARDLRPGDAQAWLDLATLYERGQKFEESWAAQAEAAKIVGSESITRDEQGRFVVTGTTLW